MRLVAKKVSLTQPAPIQVDSTEPEVIATALDQIPGRAIVNSVNLEAGRDKLDKVVPIAMEHGAALIALTIDEVGMAKTRERKLEVAKRIHELVCDEHGMDPELLIFDALTFTLTTGDDEWKPSAVETIEGIRLIKSELPGVKTSLGVSNVSFGIGAAGALGPELRLPAPLRRGRPGPRDGQPEPHHALRRDRRGGARAGRRPRLQPPRGRARALHRRTSSPRARRRPPRRPNPTAGMEPEEALHFHILRRKSEGVEDQIDKSVEKIGAVPTLNDVLLPAMKEVGDKFGAGELILPFVLQSAEVMKRAVAQLEQYLDKLEGYTKGTVVLATVFGDVHDIGKSLVNTILTNNGYTVVDLGKQVPIGTILDAAQGARRDRDRPLRAARLDLQADAAAHPGAAPAEARVPAADRRRRDQPQVRLARAVPGRQGLRGHLRARRLLLQGRLRGPGRDGPDRRARGRARRSSQKVREDAAQVPQRGRGARGARHLRRLRALRRRDRQPGPRAAVLGRARDRGRPRRGLPPPRHPRAVQAALGRARREGRGLEAAARARTSARAWSACGPRPTTCTRARCWATSPATPRATRSSCSTPRTARPCSSASYCPRQPKARPHLAWPTSSARRTAASSTSSRCRPSPPATRSPS